MKGLKKHSHADRERVIRQMVPLIRKMLGDNLVALAACCSFARNEDAPYSDLELQAFVKTMPEDKPCDGVAKLIDGMLVELVWTTRENYLKTTLDVNEHWHYSGSDRLVPIINQEFIAELGTYEPTDVKAYCLDWAVGGFTEYQEATSKVLNAVEQENRQGIPLLLFDMINQVLKLLSFLNQVPYVTASRMFTQARSFGIKPDSSDRLLDMAVDGAYQDLGRLHEVTVAVFEELETIFAKLGLELYDRDLDPARPVNEMRRMQ